MFHCVGVCLLIYIAKIRLELWLMASGEVPGLVIRKQGAEFMGEEASGKRGATISVSVLAGPLLNFH